MSKTLDAAFREAICANPDDDSDRLIYADWLDDHGNPERAEFIRTQCALARLDPSDPQWIELHLREQQLLALHRRAWLKELPGWLRSRVTAFRRGFPSTIQCTSQQYLQHQTELIEKTAIDEVNLRRGQGQGGVGSAPHLARIRRWTGQAGMSVVPLLRGMTGLVHLSGFSEENLLDVFVPAQVSTLRRLCLVVNREHLARPFPLPRVELLWLRYRNEERDTMDLREVLASANIAGVRRLLIPEHLGPVGMEQLIAAHHLTEVRELCVGVRTEGDNDSFMKLFYAPQWRHLHTLHLNHVDNETLRILAESPLVHRLRSLSLWPMPTPRDALDANGFRRFLQSGTLSNLVRLGLSTIGPIEAIVETLATAPGLSGLAYLSLHQIDRCDPALQELARSPHFPSLRAVSLPSVPSGLPWPILPGEWWWTHV